MITKGKDMASIVRDRLDTVHRVAPGSIGDLMDFSLVSCDPGAGEYVLRCRTEGWMRNVAGTLHGGMCATVVDQAMGFIAYCVKPGEGVAPTVNLQVTYHRPLIPGEDVLVRVQVLSTSKSFMHLRAEAASATAPERVCLSSSATYFYKAADQ